MTKKDFLQNTNLPTSLVDNIVKQMGSWDTFKESAQYIARHGADAGWNGFIYYDQTVTFAKHNLDTIIQVACDLANELGMGVTDMIASFGCLRVDGITSNDVALCLASDTDNTVMVMNALAWFALEEVARSYDYMMEG